MTRPGALPAVIGPLLAAALALPAWAATPGPPAPAGVAIADARGGKARLVWSKPGTGAAAVAGYRVYRDGRPFKRVRKRTFLRLRVRRAHGYRVAAYDANGHTGPKSRTVKAIRGHRAPGRPGRLRTRVSGDDVRLSWLRSRRGSERWSGEGSAPSADSVR